MADDDLRELELKRALLLENFASEVGRLKTELDRELGKVDNQLALRIALAGELEVLVRQTPGPAVTIYHSAEHPCGRVTGRSHSRSSYRQRREAEAKLKGLHRCGACGWRAHEDEAPKKKRSA